MIYRFSVYQLDTQLFELRSGDTPLQLEPKVFDLLTHFVRSRDRVVTKQDLRRGASTGRPSGGRARPPVPCMNAASRHGHCGFSVKSACTTSTRRLSR